MCCTVTEHKAANIVFNYEDLFRTLADIDNIISECVKFDHGKASLFTNDGAEAWHTINLEDLNEVHIHDIDPLKPRLIYELIDSWSNTGADWESDIDDSIEEMADYWRD